MRVLGQPTFQYARGKVKQGHDVAVKNGKRAIPFITVSIPLSYLAWTIDSGELLALGLVIFMVGLGFGFLGVLPLFESENWEKGIRGEEEVMRELLALDDSFQLLNDIVLPGGGGNIDHIVVGPTGIFVLETKNYSNKIVCWGDKWYSQGKYQKYPISSVSIQAKRNAKLLADTLYRMGFTTEVEPLIVFPNPYVQLWLHNQTVPILKRGQVSTYIRTQRPKFTMGALYLDSLASRIASRAKHENAFATQTA